jgi:DNA-binding transcriptional LysR family regulator
MDIRIMEYYLAIVREGNISAAAQALHVSQSALSRQIKDLEEELGVTLFERGSRRIKLTEEGMILRRRAEEMVRLMQITESEISQAHSSLSGEVHIGAGESLAFHHLSRIAGEIHREHPDARDGSRLRSETNGETPAIHRPRYVPHPRDCCALGRSRSR